MNRSRRDVLGLCVGLGVGIAGCLSDGSNVRYPEAEGTAGRPLVGESDRATDGRAARNGGPIPNRRLASEFERIDGELYWFAQEYDDAIDAYRTAVGEALETIRRIRDDETYGSDELDRVAADADHVEAVAKANLGGHFHVDNLVSGETAAHLETVRKFARRGDWDRTDEELGRLAAFYRSIRSDLFVRRTLSDRQIDNRLYRWLRGDGDDEHPACFELYHGPTGYSAYAYDGPRYIEREPFDDATLSLTRSRFDGVEEPTGRRMFAYLRSYAIPTADDQPESFDPADSPSTSLFVQRYRDADAASSALSSLLDAKATQEGTYSFGRDAWRRVYYRHEGDVIYAFLIQAGRYLFVAAPSRVAWEERVDWSEPLARTWFWSR